VIEAATLKDDAFDSCHEVCRWGMYDPLIFAHSWYKIVTLTELLPTVDTKQEEVACKEVCVSFQLAPQHRQVHTGVLRQRGRLWPFYMHILLQVSRPTVLVLVTEPSGVGAAWRMRGNIQRLAVEANVRPSFDTSRSLASMAN
jgi:hypothetical protein